MKPCIPSLSLPLPLLFLAACSTPSNAPPAPEEVPVASDDALVLYSAGMQAIFSDPRDAGFARALAMVDERVAELPDELDEQDFPAPALVLALDVLLAPLSLRVDLDGSGDWSQGPPVRAQLEVRGEPGIAESLATRTGMLVAQALPVKSEPSPEHPGLQRLSTPVGAAHFGASGAGAERSFLAAWGAPRSEPLALGALDLPRDAEPVLALRFDASKLQAPLEMALAMAGEDGARVRSQLKAFGLLGQPALRLTAAIGHAQDRGHLALRYANLRRVQEALGTLVPGSFTRADLARLPADATVASLSKLDPGSFGRTIRMLVPEGEPDPFATVAALTGFDLEADLFQPLGSTCGFYLSEAGGGGLSSAVLFFSVDDEKKLGDTIDRAVGMIDDLAAVHAEGRVYVREWEQGETLCWTLIFPGLPVPLEPSLALGAGEVIVAATPQALLGALAHRASGAPGLDRHPDVRRMTEDLEGLTGLSYQDTARLAANGYGWLTGLSSALANAVRSPRDGSRDPGLVLPPLAELLRDARPTILVSRYEGDDLVVRGESSRSVATNLAAMCGSPQAGLIFAGIGAAAVVPAVVQRQQALSMAQAQALRREAEAHQEDAEAQIRILELEQRLEELLQKLGEIEGEAEDPNGGD